MSILSNVDKAVSKANTKYQKAKAETKNIRKAGGKILDFIIPPPKTKPKTKTFRKGNVTCTCKNKG
jgi:hypothetical protein